MHGPYNVKVNVIQVVHTHYVKVVTYFNRTNRFNKLKDKIFTVHVMKAYTGSRGTARL